MQIAFDEEAVNNSTLSIKYLYCQLSKIHHLSDVHLTVSDTEKKYNNTFWTKDNRYYNEIFISWKGYLSHNTI